MNKPRKMTARPLTDEEHHYIETVIARCGGRRRFRIKICWKNAQLLMMNSHAKKLRYCEGFLDGKVVDVTAEAVARFQRRRKRVLDESPRHYFGVSVSRRTLERHFRRAKYYGPVTNVEYGEFTTGRRTSRELTAARLKQVVDLYKKLGGSALSLVKSEFPKLDPAKQRTVAKWLRGMQRPP
jgi:hypothetical protein